MTDSLTVAGFAIAVSGALAGATALIIAMRANGLAADANRAAAEANEIARRAEASTATVASIEADRRRDQITPIVDVRFQRPFGWSDIEAQLILTLEGPVGVNSLDAVEIVLLDDQKRTERQVHGSPPAEQIAAYVWGPFQFRTGVDGTGADRRSVPPRVLDREEAMVLFVERSVNPPWWDSTKWRSEYDEQPIRLLLRCNNRGQMWNLYKDIDGWYEDAIPPSRTRPR